jgi:hypothetical protein
VAVAVAAAALALVLAARRLLRRRSHAARVRAPAPTSAAWTAPPVGPIERLYRKTLGRLARAGWPRRPNETPREYAARVRAAGAVVGDGFDRLTDRYAAARFGGHAVEAADLPALAANLAIRSPAASHPGSGGTAARN